MALLRPYEAPSGIGLSPTETGADAAQGAARRLAAFGQQMADAKAQEGHGIAGAITDVGQVVDADITHRDISAGSANFSQFMATKNKEWEDIAKTADPNDRSVQQKFLQENLAPGLEQFQQGFSTEKSQAWAEHAVDAYRNHMFEKTTATMSTLAGEAARVNAAKTINGLSSAVAIDPSTHSIDNAIMMLDHSLGSTVDSSPNITAETAAHVKSELTLHGRVAIVKSAVSSMITNNPNVDLGAIQKKYGDYIDGAEMKMFQRAAQSQAKVDAYHDKSAAVQQRQLDDLNVHQGATKTLTDNVSIDPTSGRPIIKPQYFNDALELARKNPNAPSAAATVRTMLDWGETQMNKSDHATDPATAAAIDARMFASDNPASKLDIMRAEADKKMSRADAEIRMRTIDLRDKVPTDPQFKYGMDGAKELIDGRTPGERSMQAGKFAAFQQEFLQEYQRQKAAGTLPPDALSLRNPDSLISKMMESYKSPLAAAIGGNGGIGATPKPSPSVPAPATAAKYNAGDVVNTSEGPRRFKGGDFRNKANWEPVS